MKKVDSVTNEPISDVEFLVTDSDGNFIGNANGKFITDSAGTFTITDIAPGTTLIIKETRAKAGYLLDDTPRTLYLLTVLSVAAVIPSVTITSVFNSFPAFVADHPRLALFFLYLWKYTGICALILKAAAANIDPQLAEAAAIEGASKFTFFRRIYLFQLLPHIKFLFVFDLIGFFRLFRESYLLYGLYPPQPVYFIQNYLYNNFSNLNFQKISTASVIMMGALAAVNFAVIKMGDRNEAV